MKITQLLDVHNKYSNKPSLSSNFGDGYLIHHNSIFKNIRLSTINYGFLFTENTNVDYQTLPLVQLESILDEKKFPFLDNVSVLKKLSDRLHDVNWNDLNHGLKKNYLFHESCHAVARSVFEKEPINKKFPVLQILIEESFANTCEFLAIIDVHDKIHRIFYEQNSYTFLPDIRINLKNCVADIGIKKLFKFMLLAYLHSNFLKPNLTDIHFYQILKFIDIESTNHKYLKSLRALSKIALTLDLEFRSVTTQLHLRLNNQNTCLDNFDIMTILLENKNWSTVVDKLTQTALQLD